jgi:5-methylthioribose kinase
MIVMHHLDESNVLDYLRDRGWLPSGPARVEPLGGGVSNLVLRIETEEHWLVLKQSRAQLRTRDPWFSDLERIWREHEVMQALEPLLPEGTVPRICQVDRDNYVFLMSHAPRQARNWKHQLLAGEIDAQVGRRCGQVLGRIHQASAENPAWQERFADRKVFVQLRVEPFYERICERRPEVREAVLPLIEQVLTVSEGLCHGDFSPKNILTHPAGFTLVDYETAHWGDPTMDLGFFLSHLLLKAVHLPERRPDFATLTRAFWQGYAEQVPSTQLAERTTRGIAHLGVCLLARIDGTSPVDYLPQEPRRETARRLGQHVLLEKPANWEEVLGAVG